ncbi:MAG: PQQ-dependent sugar dehydrogenase, partial [Planctomycetota bacterium]
MHTTHATPVWALAAAFALGAQVPAGTIDFILTIDGQQEVPPLDVAASGVGTATLDTGSNLFSWDITYQDLSGPATTAHFHGPAPNCETAGVEITILPAGGPPAGDIVGSDTLSAGQVADLLAGLWYVNIHTALHPGGEIRGRVAPPPLDDPLPDIPLSKVHVQLTTVAEGLVAPNWGTSAPGDDRLFVTDQPGTLWAIRTMTGKKSVFLDVSSRLVSLGIFGEGTFDERGLLGVAFHPDYQSNGLLYTYTSEPVRGKADFSTIPEGSSANHQSVIIEWQVPSPGDPESVVDPRSARVLMRIDQPQFNHDGGAVNLGPDGMLYIALGDGGDADDEDGGDSLGVPTVGHGCSGNGANNETALGSVLRIDPLGNDSANGQYGIPPDNPFVGVPGVDEIFAYGFRNPFRFSFDSVSGDLYLADVGQNDIEEVDIVVSGGNYGWNHKEGSFAFLGNGLQPGYVTDRRLAMPAGLVDPIAEYDHDEGTAIIGGFVYRGIKIPALEGRYVFGEFARTFNADGRLFFLDEADVIRELQLLGKAGLGKFLLGMGQDAGGELYALVNETGTPFDGKNGPTGQVVRIGVKPGDLNADGVVSTSDLLQLLGDWGAGGVAADLDMNGVVSTSDLLILLANW